VALAPNQQDTDHYQDLDIHPVVILMAGLSYVLQAPIASDLLVVAALDLLVVDLLVVAVLDLLVADLPVVAALDLLVAEPMVEAALALLVAGIPAIPDSSPEAVLAAVVAAAVVEALHRPHHRTHHPLMTSVSSSNRISRHSRI
jgi:hypothetical protein